MKLIDIISIRKPIYVPLTQNMLRAFDTESIAKWLTNPSVRSSLLNIEVGINDIQLGIRLENTKFFNSPYFSEYRKYIQNTVISSYIEYLQRVKPEKSELIGRVLSYLASAAIGNMTLPTDSVGYIINDIFPHIHMVKRPSAGNCYFCSIGYGINLSADEMRGAVVDIITTPSSQGMDPPYVSLAKNYALGCRIGKLYDWYIKDPTGFIKQFPTLLRKPCSQGERDCNECVWGGNDYDPFIAEFFNVPVLSISIDRRGKEVSKDISTIVNTTNISIANTYKYYLGTSNIRYRINQLYSFNFICVFPPEIYEKFSNIVEAFDQEYENIIGYIYKGEHFNAIRYTP